jgi:hypothetical protein
VALIDTARAAASDLLNRAKQRVEEAKEYDHVGPSDEPLGWDKSGIVELSSAKMAAQLFTGYVSQRVVPVILQIRIQQTLDIVDLFGCRAREDGT